MALVTPYITDKFTAHLGDLITARLSMAIRLIDDYTKKEPIGNIKVMIRTRYLFSIHDGELEEVLNEGKIPAELKTIFQTKGILISENIIIIKENRICLAQT